VQHFISSYGYLAILLLMTAESACIPVPSELTMPLGGAIAAGAVAGVHLSLSLVIVAGVAGNVIGSYLAWAAGRYGGEAAAHRWSRFLGGRSGIERAQRWFDRYGGRAVFIGRLLPVVRTFISLPAGYARMRPVRFGVYTAVGCVPWIGGLAWAGYAAGGNWQHVYHLVNTPAYIIAGVIALLAIVGIITVIVRRRRPPPASRPGPAADPVSMGAGERRRTGGMASASTWERIERQKLRRQRQMRYGRPGDRPDPSRPAGTDLLPQIRHILVLMMENHSFDNYLGTLGRGEGFPLGDDGTPDAENPDSGGSMIRAYHASSTVQAHGVPCQSWSASHRQWAGGKMNGFVTSTEQAAPEGDKTAAMAYWTGQDLPFYHGLARTFPLADRWFASCLGPTFPNRRFLLAGTANGLMDDLPVNLLDRPHAGTIMDMLTRHGISWVNYRPASSDRSEFRRYVQYRRRRTRHHLASLGRPLRKACDVFKRDLQFTAAIYPLGMASYMAHVRSIEQFFADADSGNLPSFCIVDPDFRSFSEENPQDIRKGESFAAEVISRVMHGPGWADTLLIWTYDEHGGYYDHVAPPAAVPPDDVPGRSLVAHPCALRSLLKVLFPGYVRRAEQLVAGPDAYDSYGFRVPAVIVSPYARPDCVLPDIFDHTSVLKLVEEKWNLPALTRRDAAAASPLGALDLTAAPAFVTPPRLPAPALAWGTW
jgi:phospholipase C